MKLSIVFISIISLAVLFSIHTISVFACNKGEWSSNICGCISGQWNGTEQCNSDGNGWTCVADPGTCNKPPANTPVPASTTAPVNTPIPVLTTVPIAGQTVTICPSGTAGTNGCNYIGGDGIQAAINAAPVGAADNMTVIYLKAGTYSRQVFNTVTYDTQGSQGKFFLDTKEKNIVLKGENGTVLDGGNSAAMNALIAKNGSIIIDNLTVNGFKDEPADVICRPNQTACSSGYGIFGSGTALITIKNSRLSSNSSGIIQNGTSNATIINNRITSNGVGINEGINATGVIKNNIIAHNTYDGIFIAGHSTVTVTNNTLFNNTFHGIYISSLDVSAAYTEDPTVNISNNIITDNAGNVTNPGVGISRYISGANKQARSVISYNLLARNSGETAGGCPSFAICAGTGFILNQDPKFVDITKDDYRLQSGSPALHAGDPAIHEPDGSRSNIGAYGGAENDVSPTGYFDNGNCTNLSGWAYDVNAPNTPIQVDLWLETNKPLNSDLPYNVYIGHATANQIRNDLTALSNKNHGFVFNWSDATPLGRQYVSTTAGRTISAFGINVDSQGNRRDYYLGTFMHYYLPFSGSTTATPYITASCTFVQPTLTIPPSCGLKSLGDADCNGTINDTDFDIWKCEYLGGGDCTNPASHLKSSFDLNNKVDLNDFEIWRSNYASASSPTITPVLNSTIQGYVRGASLPVTVTLDSIQSSSTNPYGFSITAGSHTVSVPALSGYTVGYTLCYNSITCHSTTPTPGASITVNSPLNGYTDLYWHYAVAQ